MADRSVTANETFADFRETYIGNVYRYWRHYYFNNSFAGTPTDLVEACNNQAPS